MLTGNYEETKYLNERLDCPVLQGRIEVPVLLNGGLIHAMINGKTIYLDTIVVAPPYTTGKEFLRKLQITDDMISNEGICRDGQLALCGEVYTLYKDYESMYQAIEKVISKFV